MLVALALGVPALRAGGARATHCDGEQYQVTLLTRIAYPTDVAGFQGSPTYDSKVFGCLIGEEPNTSYIYPGSNQLLLRYAEDLKVPSLKARLDGLGLNKDLVLRRGQGSPLNQATGAVLGAAYFYDSDVLALDPTKTGVLKITVFLPDGPVHDSYRTVGS